MTVVIDTRSDLTLETARRVGWQHENVRLSDRVMVAMAEGRDRLLRVLEHDPEITIYGVTTGAGQMAKTRLNPEERRGWAKMSPVGAATSWGDPLPERVVRMIVLARLTNFVEGHAAVSPAIAQGVAAMLGGAMMPVVPARGQGGAGEILSLSHLFMDLVEQVEPEEKDVMCLVNGSPSATGLVTDAALVAEHRLQVAAEILALSFEAFNAPLGHLAQELEGYWNNPHDGWALSTLRGLVGGGHGGERRSYQAPVSYRIVPRMLGQAHRAATMASDVAAESLQAITDNPVWIDAVDEDHPHGQFVSTGGYHNPHALLAMDSLNAAYANLCVLAERHGAKLLDGNVSLLPDQLIGQDGGEGIRRGYMGCIPMAQTGYEEEARLYAQATLLPGSESGGFGQNDVASPVFLAWSKQERAGLCLDSALASLAPIALRALDVTQRPVPAKLAGLAATVREVFPDLSGRQPFGPGIGAVAEALRCRIYP
ncbi:MAG: aromatic amino acid lyase [Alphaproteobacteria bacterium]|jgi:histidine ammonia-lyase|nr:aromatic amino acid lyase [Rhodospirillaceae bacterium]MDG2482564.1 aromatic amino acid lyase [Alphaproteobacteria bacterium]MBT6204152.1 aromatic amino acid lyase [Rhodospirillaceae bacterium]MBT6511749.1 aromatic amino acid lyase [Rhodospirillaceae bacterium]MBT7612162.1 aromatic amino acid lyase [Rhodospirillaceae bacterium]